MNVYSNRFKTLVTSATVADPSALTLGITGLQADSTYLYGVVGLGNGTTNLDGYILMAASPVITNMAAPVASAASNITSTGFTANWAAVNNASNYDVRVYDSTLTQVGTTYNIAPVKFSLDVSGLNSNAKYTYTIKARGDGVLHFDSAPSTPVSVSTSVTGVNSLYGNSFITATGKTIISSETGMLQVYNLQGEKLIEANNVNKVYTTLQTGIYIVRLLTTNGKIGNAKVLIK